MFGKKKFSREELEQAEKNIEQGNQLILEFSGKKDFLLFSPPCTHPPKS